jgi:hypothetical protein
MVCISGFTFPDHQYAPTQGIERTQITLVAFFVFGEPHGPIVGPTFRVTIPTAFVPMPKTSVDEYYLSAKRKN